MISTQSAAVSHPTLLPRWWPRAAVAGLSAAVLTLVSSHVPVRDGGRSLDAMGYVLLVLVGTAMGICSRWPRLATLAVTASLCVFIARDYPNGPVWLTPMVALAVLSARTNRRTAVGGASLMLVALTVTALVAQRGSVLVSTIFLGWMVAAVFVGEAVRSRRAHLAGVAERALYAERSREEEAARRVAEERLRIARDLHDSVAHAMATINVQAGAAAHVLDRKPEAAGPALMAIQRASAEVLEELASMLTVLREGTERAERAPAPGLADLPRLVDTMSLSGLAVDLHQEGQPEAIPPALATAAYRIVQESLTNVLRHSQARRVRVAVVAGPDGALCVEVDDRGPARVLASGGAGVGIVGMRERVLASGGRFTAGPTPDSGFAVRARWGGDQ